jgi:hypothetical protein
MSFGSQLLSADMPAGPASGFASSTLASPGRSAAANQGAAERRQFGSSHAELSPAAREIALAIDQYKLAACRRYITCEEILAVITQLGYRRQAQA